MSIAFEPNFKRRFDRVTVPLFIRVGELSHKATDWSVGGFRVDNYFGALTPGREFDCTLVLPCADFSVHLPVRARVARRDKGTLGCSFLKLTPAQQSALHHLVEAALEGRTADLGQMLGVLRSTIADAGHAPITTAQPSEQFGPAIEDRVEQTPVTDARTSERAFHRRGLLPRMVLFVVTVTTLALLAGAVAYCLAPRVLFLLPLSLRSQLQ